MSDESKKALTKIEIIVGLITATSAAVPSILAWAQFFPISLYQPSFFRGSEFFLLIPIILSFPIVFVATVSNYFYWIIVGAFVLSIIIVGTIFWSADVSSRLHQFNWILSYCVLSFGAGVVAKPISEWFG